MVLIFKSVNYFPSFKSKVSKFFGIFKKVDLVKEAEKIENAVCHQYI